MMNIFAAVAQGDAGEVSAACQDVSPQLYSIKGQIKSADQKTSRASISLIRASWNSREPFTFQFSRFAKILNAPDSEIHKFAKRLHTSHAFKIPPKKSCEDTWGPQRPHVAVRWLTRDKNVLRAVFALPVLKKEQKEKKRRSHVSWRLSWNKSHHSGFIGTFFFNHLLLKKWILPNAVTCFTTQCWVISHRPRTCLVTGLKMII